MDYTSRFSAFIDRLSDTGGNPAAGSAASFNRPRKQLAAHRLTAHEAKQFLADAFESLARRDRVAMLYGVLSRELTDDELIRLSNMLGRVPHERART